MCERFRVDLQYCLIVNTRTRARLPARSETFQRIKESRGNEDEARSGSRVKGSSRGRRELRGEQGTFRTPIFSPRKPIAPFVPSLARSQPRKNPDISGCSWTMTLEVNCQRHLPRRPVERGAAQHLFTGVKIVRWKCPEAQASLQAQGLS